jgi:isopropylmalate/homocitrate/citramalate synthase
MNHEEWKMDFCVSPYNELGQGTGWPEEVILCDVTMRDGEQTPGVAFSLEEKKELAQRLDQVGVPQIQVGLPGRSKSAKLEAEGIGKMNLAAKKELMTRGTYDGWRDDVLAAIDCGADIIHSYFPMSPYLRSMNTPLSNQQIIQRACEVIAFMKKKGARIINISLLDATRTEEKFLLQTVNRVVEMGIHRIRLADTVGTSSPEGIYYLIQKVRESLSPLKNPPIIGLHCHNDFGLALANVFAGVKAGATLIDVSVNGLGERSGNPSLAEVALGLEVLHKVKTRIQLKHLFNLSKYVEEISGIPIPRNKPFVGEYAFADESDAHVAAQLQHPFAFQGIQPELLGNRRKLVIGKNSGENILRFKFKELNLKVDVEKYDLVLERIRELSEKQRGTVMTDDDLRKIVESLE